MDRVSTGIEELDRKLSGGYPVNKVTLITGIAGSGKTIFGIHFIYKNCLEGILSRIFEVYSAKVQIAAGALFSFDFAISAALKNSGKITKSDL